MVWLVVLPSWKGGSTPMLMASSTSWKARGSQLPSSS